MTYSSPDLTHWKLENVYRPAGFELTLNKPRVVYSKKTGNYVLWYSAGNALRTTGGFWVATSSSPAGHWSAPTQATGPNLAHDYDMSQDASGTYWIVTDVFSGEYVGANRKPYWNLWVQRLNEEGTGVVGTNETSVEIMHSVDWQAVAFSNRNGWWYITSSTTCSNCQVPTRYIRARSPLGPWETETGARDQATLNEGTLLTADGCTGQNKGASQVPNPKGREDIVLTFIWGYRSTPTNYVADGMVAHADNMQAISSQFWLIQEYDEQDRIKPYTCPTSIKVPLLPAATKGEQVKAPPPYQPDCRIRSNQSIIQEFSTPLDVPSGILEFPVSQKTDDLGPFSQAGLVLEAPLDVTVMLADAKEPVAVSFPVSELSGMAKGISIPLPRGAAVKSVKLSTTASNGCFGTMVQPKTLQGSTYGTIGAGGGEVVADEAQLYIHEP